MGLVDHFFALSNPALVSALSEKSFSSLGGIDSFKSQLAHIHFIHKNIGDSNWIGLCNVVIDELLTRLLDCDLCLG